MNYPIRMTTPACAAALAITLVAFGFTAADAQDADEEVRNWRASCVQEVGNEPLCACMAEALEKHVPKEHFSNKGGDVEFSDAMPKEAHEKVSKAALECQAKFAN